MALVKGMGGIVNAYGPRLDPDRLVERLRPWGGAAQMVGRGRSLKDVLDCTHADGIAHATVDVYNKGLRTGRLDPWV